MKKTITISVKDPCHENWDEMQPTDTGRFCIACQKTVSDFTSFTDSEFIAYFQQKKTTSCGKFTKAQLSIPIPQRPSKLTFWTINKFAAASLIAALGLPFKVHAQVKDTTAFHSLFDNKSDTVLFEQLYQIKGTIIDTRGDSVVGASITVNGTNFGTISDIDGYFELELPKNDDGYTLVCTPLAHGTKEIIVRSSGYITVTVEDIPNKAVRIIVIGASCAKRSRPTFWQRLSHPFLKKNK